MKLWCKFYAFLYLPEGTPLKYLLDKGDCSEPFWMWLGQEVFQLKCHEEIIIYVVSFELVISVSGKAPISVLEIEI